MAEVRLVTKPRWTNAVLRSAVWVAAFAWWAYLKKPGAGGMLNVRANAVGFLGATLVLAGLALHLWSNRSLARAELTASADVVESGPYRVIRNPIYVAGAPVFLGIYLLYQQWSWADLVGAAALAASFHLLVTRVEEPALRRRMGSKYEEYCRHVPRWIPGWPDGTRGRPTSGCS